MKTVDRIEVLLNGNKVGTLAPYQRYRTAFEYAPSWLEGGYSISPFSLPLEPGVKIANADPFDGLFGSFFDSLPDGWGALLMDRMLRKKGEDPKAVTPLMRLSFVGNAGRGALEYRPVWEQEQVAVTDDLDRLADSCRKILLSEETDDLDLLYEMGGSSGGARPKVVVPVSGEEWIVKFPATSDLPDIGEMEYAYHLCAGDCGIEIPEVRLFPSEKCAGYFGSKRFDRKWESGGATKVHMASVSALLETSHRIPALDYTSLMALTWQITKREEEVQKMFKRMCFNVFAHNRDDHSNNFSYLCCDGQWILAPAYDLTYSLSIGGEHATTVAGEGAAPGMDDILMVAQRAGISQREAKRTATRIRDIVQEQLGKYLR